MKKALFFVCMAAILVFATVGCNCNTEVKPVATAAPTASTTPTTVPTTVPTTEPSPESSPEESQNP